MPPEFMKKAGAGFAPAEAALYCPCRRGTRRLSFQRKDKLSDE